MSNEWALYNFKINIYNVLKLKIYIYIKGKKILYYNSYYYYYYYYYFIIYVILLNWNLILLIF